VNSLDISHYSRLRETLRQGHPPSYMRKTQVDRQDVRAGGPGGDLLRFAVSTEVPQPPPHAGDGVEVCRIKARNTFVHKGEFRYELTEVRSGADARAAERAPVEFEVELEWCGQRSAPAPGGPALQAQRFLMKVKDLLEFKLEAARAPAAPVQAPPPPQQQQNYQPAAHAAPAAASAQAGAARSSGAGGGVTAAVAAQGATPARPAAGGAADSVSAGARLSAAASSGEGSPAVQAGSDVHPADAAGAGIGARHGGDGVAASSSQAGALPAGVTGPAEPRGVRSSASGVPGAPVAVPVAATTESAQEAAAAGARDGEDDDGGAAQRSTKRRRLDEAGAAAGTAAGHDGVEGVGR
jgi:hypothetical protein